MNSRSSTRMILRPLAAAAVALALLLGIATAAQAAPPSPDSGTRGTAVTVTLTPPHSWTQLAVNASTGVGLTPDGRAWSWGTDFDLQLGDGSGVSRSTPGPVTMPAGVSAFTQISVGTYHVLALGDDGKAYTWGRNNYGQLGNSTNTDSSTPVAVTMPTGVKFTQISTGSYHSLALGDNGRAYAWGEGANGQIGNGSTADRNRPVAVTLPDGVSSFTAVSAGGEHSLAIGVDGNTYAWGYNEYGQLGNNTVTNSTSPVAVTMPAGVKFTQISAGGEHSLAIGDNNKTYGWGRNNRGQVGDNSGTMRRTPVAVSLATGVPAFTQVSAGFAHSLAIGDNGRAYAWGWNTAGAVGDNTLTSRDRPVAATLPSGVTSFSHVSAGLNVSLAIGNDSKAYAWGKNYSGELGDGTNTDRRVPTAVAQPAVVVTRVTFGGVNGTSLTKLSDSTWRVNAPPRPNGPDDVVVSWTLGGVVQTPITYTNGFTYVGPKVEITTQAYRNSARTVEIPRGGVVAPGATIYWRYTVKNTGPVPVSITQIKRNNQVLALSICATQELAAGATTTCNAESTV